MSLAEPSIAARIGDAATRLLQTRRSHLNAALDAAGLQPGSAVVLIMDNTLAHAGLLLLLIERSIAPLLMTPESTAPERAAQLSAVHGHAILALNDELELSVTTVLIASVAVPPVAPLFIPGIFLLTSGSSGLPARVFRSLDSWLHEGRRYTEMLRLEPRHAVLLAAPLSHAYILGWLWACVEAGCKVLAARPTDLGAIADLMRSRATHCALTPALASLLARRAAPAPRPVQLEVVMAGAGPVDAELEARFSDTFGLGLSRNYGSTESGALCAGLAPLPPLVLGALMPNLRLVDAPAPNTREVFALSVELEDGRIYRTGDLARYDESGLTIIGREGSAIRRGERWISPFEIDSVLKAHPDVLDCQVRGVSSGQPGNDRILASVVLRNGRAFDPSALREFCAGYLARSKLPDRIEQVPAIARNAQGKPVPAKRYRSAAPAALVEAAMAYKRAHLLFALVECGVLADLDRGSSIDRIAFERGLHADTLARALELAHWLELVVPAGAAVADVKSEAASPDLQHVLQLERLLDTSTNSTHGLTDLMRKGHLETSARAALAAPELPELYTRAMNGSHKQLTMRSIMREFDRRSGARDRGSLAVLDISATGGGYLRWLSQHERLDRDRSSCLKVGGLTAAAPVPARQLSPEDIESLDRTFDLVIFDNAMHHGSVVQLLPLLVQRLSPRGAVIVDEIFIDPENATVGIDWLSHGGCCLPTEGDLVNELAAVSLRQAARIRIPSPLLHLVSLFNPKE